MVSFMTGCVSSASENEDRRMQAAEARLRLGLAYLDQGEMTAAYTNLLRAERHAPKDYRVQLALALYSQQSARKSSQENQQISRADHYYQQALRLSPGNRTVFNHYGAFLCDSGKYNQAQQQFTAALQTLGYTSTTDILENSGYCFLREGQLDKAAVQLTKVVTSAADRGERVLAEAERCLEQKNNTCFRMLLGLYQQALSVSSQSSGLEVRFAALNGRRKSLDHMDARVQQDTTEEQVDSKTP